MHHLLEIVAVLLVALIIGWIIGWFLRCVLFRGRDVQRTATTDGRGKLGLLGASAAGVAAAAGAGAGTAEGASHAAVTASASAGDESAADREDGEDGEDAETPSDAAQADEAAEAAAKEDDAADIEDEKDTEEKADTEEAADDTAAAAAASTATAAAATAAANDEQKEETAAEKEAPAYGLSGPIGGKADDLQMISGIGPKLEKLLHGLGIYHFSQIANWTPEDIAEVDDKLQFKGRIERDEWVRQAKLLAAGKMEQFEEEYGTGGKKGADGKTRPGSRTRRK